MTGCDKTYLAQFAEHPDHQHVHLHLVPRGPDLPVDARGPKVFDLIGNSAAPHVPAEQMNGIAGSIRQAHDDQ